MLVLSKQKIIFSLFFLWITIFFVDNSYSKTYLSNEGVLKEAKLLVKTLFPDEQIKLRPVGSTIVVSGNISGAKVASQALEVLQEFFKSKRKKILNFMEIRDSQQVMMRVRIGEIKRNYLKGSKSTSIRGGESTFVNLEERGVFRTLAEPSLTAISGEKAKFLAGVEIPVPVSQGSNGITIDYKPVGVSVIFAPTVISKNRIRIKVLSEVSEVALSDAVINQGIKMPSISSRKASTTIELAPGESFMIAGLVKANSMAGLRKVPGIGEMPFFGKLFQSPSFKDDKTELVIAVTPYIVYPVESKDIMLPTDTIKSSDLKDMLFYEAVKNNSKDSDLNLDPQDLEFEGQVGFSLE